MEKLASLTDLQLTTSRELDATGYSYQCAYNTNSGTGGVNITIIPTGGANNFESAEQTDKISQSAEHVTELSGLGDKAFSATDGLRALFGDRLIYVAGVSSLPKAKAVIEAVEAKLQ